MAEVYLFFLGWGSITKTFKKSIETAPPGKAVTLIHCIELMPHNDPKQLNKNLLKLLEDRGFGRVNIIGHSLGGALALQFAYHHPEKVKHLYLIDSEGIYDEVPFMKMIFKFIQSHTNFFLGDIPLLLMSMLSALRRPIWHAKMSHFAHHIDLQKEAAALKVPVTLLWGEEDGVIPVWQGEKLHSLIPKSKLIILSKMNHDWILKHPEKFWANVVE